MYSCARASWALATVSKCLRLLSVDLYIPQREQMLRAHVQWRKGEEMGVTLVDAELRDGGLASEQDLAKRVEKLEAEVAALRKLLKRLKAEASPGTEDAA
jgi:hypothetical protein